MTISTAPIASGAREPAVATAMPTVKTKKNVPMNSTPSFRWTPNTHSLPRMVPRPEEVSIGGREAGGQLQGHRFAMVGSAGFPDT
jgi:hypothetical protein